MYIIVKTLANGRPYLRFASTYFFCQTAWGIINALWYAVDVAQTIKPLRKFKVTAAIASNAFWRDPVQKDTN